MKAIQVGAPGGLDRLKVVDMEEPGAPGQREVRVRLNASSLNYHDYVVARAVRSAASVRTRRLSVSTSSGKAARSMSTSWAV